MKKRILLADDDSGILDALTMVLEDAEYSVTATDTGKTVRKLQKPFPDIILLDIWMSGENGCDICVYLKQQETTKHIPIIMISASRNADTMAREAGADGFLAKPFDMDTLLETVRKYLKK